MHNAHSWLDSIEVRTQNTVNKILSTTEFKRGSSLELGRGRGQLFIDGGHSDCVELIVVLVIGSGTVDGTVLLLGASSVV